MRLRVRRDREPDRGEDRDSRPPRTIRITADLSCVPLLVPARLLGEREFLLLDPARLKVFVLVAFERRSGVQYPFRVLRTHHRGDALLRLSRPVSGADLALVRISTALIRVESSIASMQVDEAEACLAQIARERGYGADPQLGAFTVAYQVCSAYTVKELAAEFRTDPVPASAAAADAVDLSEPEAQRAAAEGCFVALT